MQIIGVALTGEFLIWATNKKTLHHYSLRDWKPSFDYTHDEAITAIYPNSQGTRVVVVDAVNKGYVVSVVDEKVEIPKFPQGKTQVMWDTSDPAVFVAIDRQQRSIGTYTYSPQTIRGPTVSRAGTTKLPPGFEPVLLCDGHIHGQKASGSPTLMCLSSHDCVNPRTGPKRTSQEDLTLGFSQLLAINRVKQAWERALKMKDKDMFLQLARKAMELYDIDLAIKCFRELKDVSMVYALQDIQHIEDKFLVAGYLFMFAGEFQKAQMLFLNSSRPITALEMRRDLFHWDHALQLAQTLAPDQIPIISREYAQQLEIKGEYQQACSLYEKALIDLKDRKDAEHTRVCNGGVARTTLRLGMLQQGKTFALKTGDKFLLKECAQILEGMSLLPEAAEMYVQAEQYERAAMIYCQTKSFHKAAPLMDRITTPKIHQQYAKAKEAEKMYAEAAIAYEKAKDMDEVVRLLLHHLDNPQKAFNIVRTNRSPEGALRISQYCSTQSSWQGTIEFLLIAKHNEEAFQVAMKHSEMGTYAQLLGDDGTQEEYMNIAIYYENVKEYAKAALYYSLCNQFAKAVKFYLMCGESKLEDAINVVRKARGQSGHELLTRAVLDFITGETTGTKRDPRFILKLYLAIGDYAQAGLTAVTVATEDVKTGMQGALKNARDTLFDMHQQLHAQKITMPAELKRLLLLLHTYQLIKKHLKQLKNEDAKEHNRGVDKILPRLLIRIAQNISKFPTLYVNILTLTCMWCHKTGLRKTAFEYANQLMRSDSRNQIEEKFKKKIEKLARTTNATDADDTLSPCPFCEFKIPEFRLDCPSCKNIIPWCASTTKHMVLDDWTFCPRCNFPHLHSVFMHRLQFDKSCDMCGQQVGVNQAVKVSDARSFLIEGGIKSPSQSGDASSSSSAEKKENGEEPKLSEEQEKKFKQKQLAMQAKKEDQLQMEDS